MKSDSFYKKSRGKEAALKKLKLLNSKYPDKYMEEINFNSSEINKLILEKAEGSKIRSNCEISQDTF